MIILFMLILIILFLMTYSNILLMWLFMTMLSMTMLTIISKTENKLKYFLIQEISVLSLIFMIFKNMKTWLILPLFLKMGMTPLHTWMMEIFLQTMKLEMILFISLAKIMPAILIMNFLHINIIYILLTFFLFSQIFPLIYQNNMKTIIFFSSLINFLLIFMLSFNNFNTSFLLTWFYLSVLLITFPNMKNKNFNQLTKFLIFLLAGIPLSPIFFMKIFIYFSIMTMTIFFSIILMTTFFYYIYIMMYLNQMKNIEMLNKNLIINNNWKNMMFSLLFILMIII